MTNFGQLREDRVVTFYAGYDAADTADLRSLLGGMRSSRRAVRHYNGSWKNDSVELDFRRGQRLH